MRFLPVATTAVLVELEDLPETLALLRSLAAEPIAGVGEIVPGARTILVGFDPLLLKREALVANLAGRTLSGSAAVTGAVIEIPVHYDGEDLVEVAGLLGMSTRDVVERHTASDWFVAFTGFAPGFAYLTGGDELLRTVPRRSTPRTRIPAGAVAVAGGFSGVYPKTSPGGWQILGQTMESMWDLERDPPALLQPGARVRFIDAGGRTGAVVPPPLDGRALDHTSEPAFPYLEIRRSGMQALLQDGGRRGQASHGVGVSGAMDRGALRAANRLAGNDGETACIEILQGGLVIASHGDTVVALTGAQVPLRVTRPDGQVLPVATYQPLALSDGDVLDVGTPHAGMRSYLAVRGGFDRPPVLGSLSFDTLAQVGPPPLAAGDRLAIRRVSRGGVVGHPEAPPVWLPDGAGNTVVLDVVLGPRTDWFTAGAIELLARQDWLVTPESSRVGVRLLGERPLERCNPAELPSEGTLTGAIQVPINGQPVLFLADHPLTGGYPVIACIAPCHLDLAGQLPVGTHIRFKVIQGFAPLIA